MTEKLCIACGADSTGWTFCNKCRVLSIPQLETRVEKRRKKIERRNYRITINAKRISDDRIESAVVALAKSYYVQGYEFACIALGQVAESPLGNKYWNESLIVEKPRSCSMFKKELEEA